MINVLIADDHPVVRRGLKNILSSASDIAVKGEASNGKELLEYLKVEDVDVILLDITMPQMDGLEAIGRIKTEYPEVAVLVLSMNPEEIFGLRALKLGASGYLNKDSAPEQLVSAIHRVASGKVFVSPLLADTLATHMSKGTASLPHERLSNREYQVMIMIARGESLKQIANELSLSVKTISTHRFNILQKMKLENNAQIVSYALQNGLLS